MSDDALATDQDALVSGETPDASGGDEDLDGLAVEDDDDEDGDD